MLGLSKKCALLIDFDNVIGMTGGDFVAKIEKWTAWLEDGGFEPKHKRRGFAVKRVYWNPMNERYRPAFEAAGFQAFACRAIAKEKKSSADIVMTLDAVDIAAEINGLREIILLSSDTDFVPVVSRLRDRNIDVVAMGNEENPTAAVYREYADEVVLRSEFIAAFSYQRQRRGLFGIVAPAAAERTVEPIRQPAPNPARAPAQSRPDPLELASERVVRAAKAALGSPLGKQSVRRAVQDIPGFSPSGASPWLGCGSYREMLKAIVKRRRKELKLYAFGNGGVSVSYTASDA